MNDCSNHKKEVAGITDMKQLAEIIGDLHYETLAQLLWELHTKFHNDSLRDLDGEKLKLSSTLQRASDRIYQAFDEIEFAKQISKPFMKEPQLQIREKPTQQEKDLNNALFAIVKQVKMNKISCRKAVKTLQTDFIIIPDKQN